MHFTGKSVLRQPLQLVCFDCDCCCRRSRSLTAIHNLKDSNLKVDTSEEGFFVDENVFFEHPEVLCAYDVID
jgi:hypothetical protein